MWIESFRGMTNLGLNFYHKFRFEFNGKDKLSFNLINNTDHIDKYYPNNQYYNILVGKNGSGKSSVLELIYQGVSTVIDFSKRKEVEFNGYPLQVHLIKINKKIFAIFFDESKNLLLFWGAKINNKDSILLKDIHSSNKIEIPKYLEEDIYENNWYRNIYINLSILSINNDFGNVLDIQEQPITSTRKKISDNIKKSKYIDEIIKKNFERWKKFNLRLEESRVYQETLNYERNDFIKEFILNYHIFKKFSKNAKDIEFPKRFFIKFTKIDKSYYENQFDRVVKKNKKLENIKNLVLNYYDFFNKIESKLSLTQKMKMFLIFYLCDYYIFYSSNPEFLLQMIDFNILQNIKEDKIDEFLNDLYDNYLDKEKIIEIQGQKGNFKLSEIAFFRDMIKIIEKNKTKIQNDIIIFDLNDSVLDDLKLFMEQYIEVFRLGKSFMIFDFYPTLSEGHIQLFKIFNFINELLRQEEVKKSKNILLLIDEPDNNLHYEWQRNFIKWLSIFLSQFKDINFQVLITTHSAFMLSDIPKENIIALDKRDNKVLSKKLQNSTLAQNLFTLLNDEFFIDSFLGGYVTEKLKEILKKSKLNKEDEELIANIGEEIIRKSFISKIKGKK